MTNLPKEILISDIPKEVIEENYKLGLITKSAYEKWERDEMAEVGDWQCSWCDWKELCYPQSVLTLDVESGKVKINDALSKLNI